MSGTPPSPKKVRVPDLVLMKERGERIVMLTAYDATMARLLDRAGVDLLLVGDSLGNVILGLDTTVPVTLDAMVHHTRAVARGASRALVVADMPFLTYQVSPEDAWRMLRALSGGRRRCGQGGGRAPGRAGRPETHGRGITSYGARRLTPQHVHRLGGMRRQGGDAVAAEPCSGTPWLSNRRALRGRA